MTNAAIFTSGRFRGFDETNAPLVGGKVFSYISETTTPQATYTDSTGSAANTNPVILDGNGEADIYLNGSYTIVLKDSNDVVQWSKDGLGNVLSVSSTITATSTTSNSIAVASKTFAIEAGKDFTAGGFVLMSYNGDPTKYMIGQIASYISTSLVVNVLFINGSGTFADWTITISGPAGATGSSGAPGAGTGDMLKANNLSELTNFATARANIGLGTSSTLDVGTTASKVVQLTAAAKLPAVDGSLLTNLPSGGGNMLKSENLSGLSNYTTARSNLGLGSSAILDVGTTANKIVQLDGSAKLPAVDGSALINVTNAGSVIGGAYTEELANPIITTVIPLDNTIPQISEGTEILSVSYTAISATSRLRFRVTVPFGMSSGADYFTIALFKSTSANAIATTTCRWADGGGDVSQLTIERQALAGSTSSITYSVRAGKADTSGSVGLGCDFNGTSDLFGGTIGSSLVIEEIKV